MKAFLSHSSMNKIGYVGPVATRLGKASIVYDEFTFEEGRKPLEEILSGLHASDLFVIFISEDALESDWVKREILKARELRDEDKLKILPIIIDGSITYNDKRIPEWLRSYNLKPVPHVAKAVSLIRARLVEACYKKWSHKKFVNNIFVNRNFEISEIEKRFDDPTLKKPIATFACGLDKIGRKELLKHSYKKTNTVRQNYFFPVINLGMHDSVDDFILKVRDLGFELNATGEVPQLGLKVKMNEKQKIATSLLKKVQEAGEIILINDSGCLVKHDRRLIKWFENALKSLKGTDVPCLAITSKYRLYSHKHRDIDIFSVDVPELDKSARTGLLQRTLKELDIDIDSKDITFFSGLLTGLPGQAVFCAQKIKNEGINVAKKDSHEIVDYGNRKIEPIIKDLKENDLDLLYLLSRFEFISIAMIQDILTNDQDLMKSIDLFLGNAICELCGASGEYIRLNDAIKDYIQRGRKNIPKRFESNIKELLSKTFDKDWKDYLDGDLAGFFFGVRSKVLRGEHVDEKLLFPSIALKSIKDMYDTRRYGDVKTLSKRLLEYESSLDERTIDLAKEYLCLAMARTGEEKMLEVVQHFDGWIKNFLLGFYHRQKGKFDKSQNYLEWAIKDNPNSNRVKGELALVYNLVGNHEEARSLEEEIYKNNPNNVYAINHYLRGLLQSPYRREVKEKIENLLTDLEKVSFPSGQEMYHTNLALYEALLNNNYDNAVGEIDNSISKFPDSPYPTITKIEILHLFEKWESALECIESYEGVVEMKQSSPYKRLIRLKVITLANLNRKTEARRLMDKELRSYNEIGRKKLEDIIDNS